MITKKLIKPISKVGVANVDLDNYYNKSEIDNKITTIDNEIATKQDTLIAGSNISILNNVISANVPQIDLSNYYNKTQIDSQVNTINNELNNKANVSDLNGYAKLDESNNSNFYIGNKNSQHIWFAKPFQYGRATYASIKIRNGGSNYLTLETNFTDNTSNLSSPNGSLRVYNLATPTGDDEAANKQYVDNSITPLTNEITTIKQEQTTQNQQIATKQDILTAGNNITIENNVISSNVNLDNYYTKSEIDTKIDWEVVDATSITRENQQTIIPLNGKRWVHLQGRFTQYTSNTGSWNNFTPFTLDTQNYNYRVRFPIYDWNTQTLRASIECVVENGNLILNAYNTSNQSVAYYLWGDVLVK